MPLKGVTIYSDLADYVGSVLQKRLIFFKEKPPEMYTKSP